MANKLFHADMMRHGGCRRIYNEHGDLSLAQQILGNSDLKTTLVYAKRQASALTQVTQLIAFDCIETSKKDKQLNSFG